jgi:hypothetical protein
MDGAPVVTTPFSQNRQRFGDELDTPKPLAPSGRGQAEASQGNCEIGSGQPMDAVGSRISPAAQDYVGFGQGVPTAASTQQWFAPIAARSRCR